jgi:uncharacterized membrane protein (UPF0127 family)
MHSEGNTACRRSARRLSAARRAGGLLAALLAALLLGCGPRTPRVTLDIGGVPFSVEVARTDAERTRGLMHRAHLGEHEGMLFVFDRDQHLEFWMKDTTLPLSIAFLSSDGRILEIDDLQPLSLQVVRSELSCRYALEVAQGAFAQAGVSVGDSIALPPEVR